MRSTTSAGSSLAVRLGLLHEDPPPLVFTPEGIWNGFKADFRARKEVLSNLAPYAQLAPKELASGFSSMMQTAADVDAVIGMM